MYSLHAGLDLSRRRLDVCVVDPDGDLVEELAVRPDSLGLAELGTRYDSPVAAVIESMNGSRFVHDRLEEAGWAVSVADARLVKGLAPLAAKTDKIDARVLAELSRRDLVPQIWLPDPDVRADRERSRFRLHLIHHRVALKNRIHAALIAYGKPCPVSDLFGRTGRQMLTTLDLPEPWRSNIDATLATIDHLDDQIRACEIELRQLGATHPYVPLLVTAPGIGPILGYTIAAEIGDIARFATPKKLVGYTGLCPRVDQSGERDRRGPITKNGPRYLRWALIEATIWAARHPAYRDRYQHTKTRLGKQRGTKVARVDIARRLTTAIWHMLTKNETFNPAGPAFALAA